MKFKIASILELVIPLSILVVLSLSACGGGANGNGTRPFDGTWTATYMGYTFPAPGSGVTAAYCDPSSSGPLVIDHGFGSVSTSYTCIGAGTPTDPTGAASSVWGWDISVTIDTSSGVGVGQPVVKAKINGGILTGTCINTNACQAGGAAGSTDKSVLDLSR